MTIEHENIIYELKRNGTGKTANIIKCLSNKAKITIPDSVYEPSTIAATPSGGNNDYKVIGITANAFKDCENLQLIEFETPSNIKFIGSSAFENCISLQSFNIPANINKITPRCFFNCVNLKEISSDSNITHIFESAFEGCKKLNTINEIKTVNLQLISKNAFKNCYKLLVDSKQRFDSLEQIHINAFENCRKSIILGDKIEYNSGSGFDNIHNYSNRIWKSSSKFSALSVLLTIILFVFLILENFHLYSFRFPKHIIFVLSTLVLFSFSALYFQGYKYKNNQYSFTASMFFLFLAFFFLSGLCTLFFPNERSFNNISLTNYSDDGHFNASFETLEQNPNLKTEYIDKIYYSYDMTEELSGKKVSEKQSQQILIKQNDDVWVNIINPLNQEMIQTASLDFTNANKCIKIKTYNMVDTLYISFDGQTHDQMSVDKDNNYYFNIDNNTKFTISIPDKLDHDCYDPCLTVELYKTTNLSFISSSTANILFFIFLSITILLLLLTLILFIVNIITLAPKIEQHKVALSLIPFFVAIIMAVCHIPFADIFKDFSSIISQF